MDSALEIVNSNLVETQPSDPHLRGSMDPQDLFAAQWQIQELRRYASQIRQLGQKFSDVMKQPEQSLNVLLRREDVDNHLPWQAGRHLCELFDYGLLDGTEIAGKRKVCELRVLSPVWREKEIKRLNKRAMGAGRLGGMNQEPPDPEYIKILQKYHKLCESVPAGKPADIDSLIVRATWWRFILRELTRSEEYRTRLGTKVEQNFGIIVGMQERWAGDYSGAPLDASRPFSGDSTEERLRLRLHTAARIQTVACEILAEILESKAGSESDWLTIKSEWLQRQNANAADAAPDAAQPTEDTTQTADQPGETDPAELGDSNERSIMIEGEMVTIRGFGEKVPLKYSPGVQRLIRIVCSEQCKADAIELARIGADQSSRNSNSVSGHENGMTERNSPNDSLGKPLGDDPSAGVKEKVGELIAEKKNAESKGNQEEADRLKKVIDSTLAKANSDLGTAAKAVSNSLKRTYRRLKRDGGEKLAKHFSLYINRPSKSPDFVYDHPDENKMPWIQK